MTRTEAFLPWLANELLKARVDAGIRSEREMARLLGRDHSALNRLERGERWPRDVDGTVSAYAQATGVPAYELWMRALAAWGAAIRHPEGVVLANRLRK